MHSTLIGVSRSAGFAESVFFSFSHCAAATATRRVRGQTPGLWLCLCARSQPRPVAVFLAGQGGGQQHKDTWDRRRREARALVRASTCERGQKKRDAREDPRARHLELLRKLCTVQRARQHRLGERHNG
eukprot:58860-Rhodomonas_salina.1